MRHGTEVISKFKASNEKKNDSQQNIAIGYNATTCYFLLMLCILSGKQKRNVRKQRVISFVKLIQSHIIHSHIRMRNENCGRALSIRIARYSSQSVFFAHHSWPVLNRIFRQFLKKRQKILIYLDFGQLYKVIILFVTE